MNKATIRNTNVRMAIFIVETSLLFTYLFYTKYLSKIKTIHAGAVSEHAFWDSFNWSQNSLKLTSFRMKASVQITMDCQFGIYLLPGMQYSNFVFITVKVLTIFYLAVFGFVRLFSKIFYCSFNIDSLVQLRLIVLSVY